MRSSWISGLSLTELVIASLAVWRVTHLLWGEDGPWNCFVRLRTLAGNSLIGQALDCFYCLSLWIALPVAYWMGLSWPDRVIAWMALSGAAILLERMTSARDPIAPPAVWSEDAKSSLE